MFCQKKTHKTKVNSCFDSSEITANEGEVVNEFKKKMKNCNQRMIYCLSFSRFDGGSSVKISNPQMIRLLARKRTG